MKKVLLNLMLLVNIAFCNDLWAWNDKITHKDISEKAAKYSILQNTGFMKTIGYEKGLEIADDNSSDNTPRPLWRKHIEDGAIEEDAGNIFTAYYYNHFHNPLRSWNQAGLNTIYPGINGMSSLVWAQDVSTPNLWSWKKARDYYYLALISQTDMQRQENFANTFKGLGHIIHVIEDAAQPAHVRDDPHPLDDIGIVPQFENWVKNNRLAVLSFMSNPMFPTASLNTSAVTGYIPITQFWDTDQYNESTPVSALPSGNTFGLSEYTQANFFSEDTINASNFPYPRITTDIPIIERNFTNTFWNTTYPRSYYLKNCCGEINGGNGYLLSAVDYLDYYRQQYPLLSPLLPKITVLDDNVYFDYATLLLPRAVGYSAGLINYFFRGELHVALLVPSADQAVLDFSNSNDTGRDINTVALFLQNKTTVNGQEEPIGSGTLTLTVCYTDTLTDAQSCSQANPVPVPQAIPSITSNTFFNAFFTLNQTIPTQSIKDITYYIAFQGQLGSEEGAVIGKVIKGPILYSVSHDEGIEGATVTMIGTSLSTADVRFHHDPQQLYSIEVTNRTDTTVTAKVPGTAGLSKPGYGGLRVRNTLATGEKLYSNPIPFYPIAEGGISNSGQFTIGVTIEAISPLKGDYQPLPGPIIINNLPPQGYAPLQLKTGFIYKATAPNSSPEPQAIEYLRAGGGAIIDFLFSVQ